MRGLYTPEIVGINCPNCGLTKGEDGKHGVRCCKCGSFADKSDKYCAKHEVNIKKLSGYNHCPTCREENRVRQMEQEMHARRSNPRMHPTVDAPRY